MPGSKPNEIHLVRLYDAPLKMVWSAWTDPEQVAQWWGPRGFHITTHSRDLRTGGHWNYTMHGPDGVDYPNVTKYLEVVEPTRLVYDHGASDTRPPLFRVTVRFTEANGKTRMEMTSALATPEAAAETRAFIKKARGDATWDRLAEYLDKRRTGKESFVIVRSFAAPIQTMFKMWTEPAHLARWIPPTGATMEYLRADIRPGGSSFYKLSGPNGSAMYGRAEYLEIQAPSRVVYTQQFCDAHEKVTRHPLAATWPETVHTRVLLFEEGPDQTRVELTWEPHGAITPIEMETFAKARSGMTEGWTGSFDKLEAALGAPSPRSA
jgi:uncharacterized protein YndB with AHSA1/START domain